MHASHAPIIHDIIERTTVISHTLIYYNLWSGSRVARRWVFTKTFESLFFLFRVIQVIIRPVETELLLSSYASVSVFYLLQSWRDGSVYTCVIVIKTAFSSSLFSSCCPSSSSLSLFLVSIHDVVLFDISFYSWITSNLFILKPCSKNPEVKSFKNRQDQIWIVSNLQL